MISIIIAESLDRRTSLVIRGGWFVVRGRRNLRTVDLFKSRKRESAISMMDYEITHPVGE